MQIDHDPNEPKIDRGPGPWRWAFPLVAIMWVWYFYFIDFNWPSIAIGIVTGVLVTAWAIDITGNKTPEWMRSKPPGTGGS